MHDHAGELEKIELAQANEITASADSDGVDISDYIGTLKIMNSINAVSGTTPTYNAKIQTSDDDSTYTDVTGAAFTEVTTTDGFQEVKVDTRAVGKYIRISETLAGTTPVYRRCVLVVGRKHYAS